MTAEHSLVDGTQVWPIWHRVCRGVMFYSRVPVTWDTVTGIGDIVLVNGQSPTPESPIRCGTCGQMPTGPWEISPLGRPSG